MSLPEIGNFLGGGLLALSSLAPAYVLFRFLVFPVLDHERRKPEFIETENVNCGFFDGGATPVETVKELIAKEVEIDQSL